jgi:putative flavoprotein involved in K+ transport
VTEAAIDAVIYATGYRPNLDYLADLGALNADGQPSHRRGISTTVPGLAYVGLSNQWTYASATLRGVGSDAAYVVGQLQRHVHASAAARHGRSTAVRRLFGTWHCCARKEGAA